MNAKTFPPFFRKKAGRSDALHVQPFNLAAGAQVTDHRFLITVAHPRDGTKKRADPALLPQSALIDFHVSSSVSAVLLLHFLQHVDHGRLNKRHRTLSSPR